MPADGTWLNRLGAPKPRTAGRSSAPGPPAASWSSAFAVIEDIAASAPRFLSKGESSTKRAPTASAPELQACINRVGAAATQAAQRIASLGLRPATRAPGAAAGQQPSDARVAHVITPALVPELTVLVETLELALFWAIKPPEPPILGFGPRSKSGAADAATSSQASGGGGGGATGGGGARAVSAGADADAAAVASRRGPLDPRLVLASYVLAEPPHFWQLIEACAEREAASIEASAPDDDDEAASADGAAERPPPRPPAQLPLQASVSSVHAWTSGASPAHSEALPRAASNHGRCRAWVRFTLRDGPRALEVSDREERLRGRSPRLTTHARLPRAKRRGFFGKSRATKICALGSIIRARWCATRRRSPPWSSRSRRCSACSTLSSQSRFESRRRMARVR